MLHCLRGMDAPAGLLVATLVPITTSSQLSVF